MPLYLRPEIRPSAASSMEELSEEGSCSEVSVVDVYDIASEIGKECEKLIDSHGADSITNLMPKVINALELLENLATKNERENTTVQELRAKIAQLESDKIGKAEDRQRFEKVNMKFFFFSIIHSRILLRAVERDLDSEPAIRLYLYVFGQLY